MQSCRPTTAYDPRISWKTLSGYARAVLDFTHGRRPALPASSLARVPGADAAALPAAQHLDVPGGRLGYRHYPAETSRRTLVLVHGSAGFGDQFCTMARLIARWDIAQVYTVDMRGHGLSDGARGHAKAAPDQMVGDLAAFVTHVRAEDPAAKLILGGHSAGGGLVLGFSRCTPDLVDGYLFLAPFLGLGSPVSRRHFGGWVKVRVARLFAIAAANLFGVDRFNTATVLEFDPRSCARDPRLAPGWSFGAVLAFGPGRWIESAPPIAAGQPVLLIAGEADECFHHDLYRQAFETIAPHAAMPEVGAIGHWDILADMKSITVIGAWLAQQAATSRAAESTPTSLRQTSRYS